MKKEIKKEKSRSHVDVDDEGRGQHVALCLVDTESFSKPKLDEDR